MRAALKKAPKAITFGALIMVGTIGFEPATVRLKVYSYLLYINTCFTLFRKCSHYINQ